MGTPRSGWIVCEGTTRPIVDAIVDCPLRGPVTAVECLGCHLLVTSSVERGTGGWCVAEPGAPAELVAGSATHRQHEGAGTGLR